MTREAQLIVDWASQFTSCAVDNIPFDVLRELRNNDHPEWSASLLHFESARFRNGKYVAGLMGFYADRYDLVHDYAIENVTTYDSIFAPLTPEPEISIDLTEVL